MAVIHINSASAKREAIRQLEALPEDGTYIVWKGLYSKDKTKAQRDYAHECMRIIAHEVGLTEKEQKLRIVDKLDFAYRPGGDRIVRIFDWLADRVPEFKPYRDRFIKLPVIQRSTESYTREEYSRFIGQINIEAYDAGVRLPLEKDL